MEFGAAVDPNGAERVASVDVFRGLTVLLMVFVIAVGAGGYRDLPQTGRWFGSLPVSTWNHAEVGWERFAERKKAEGLSDEQIGALPEARLQNVGLTVTDLVAPFFVFIVGVAVPLSRSRRGALPWRRVLRRTATLVLAGALYLSLILGLSWWWGILQAVGVSYLMAAASLRLPRWGRWAAVFAVLGAHMALSHWAGWWLRFGETDAPFWTVAQLHGSWAKPLTVHCRPWVSISYGAMAMIGALLGEAAAAGSRAEVAKRALLLGAVFGALGYGIHELGLRTGLTGLSFNKPDVTASYAMFSSAVGALTLLALYFVVDVWKVRRWAYPLTVVGTNALLAYFMQVILRLALRALRLESLFAARPDEAVGQWASLVPSPGWSSFFLDKTGYNGLAWALLWALCLWTAVWFCNRRNIYWRL